jgi:hypothetical protein
MPSFFVSFPDELTSEDRAALSRPGFELLPTGAASREAEWDGDAAPDDWDTRQWLRLVATDGDDARRQVVEALGREPDGLDVIPGRQ